MTAAHRVAIVVAPTVAADLARVADDRHVWALRGPENELVAKERWATAAELSAYGFDDISPSQRGFTARREA
jgi:hypothetical protein